MPSPDPDLFRGLLEDAALFAPQPPGLDVAVARHRRLRRGPYAAWLGPLHVPVAAVPAVADLAGLADLAPAPEELADLTAGPQDATAWPPDQPSAPQDAGSPATETAALAVILVAADSTDDIGAALETAAACPDLSVTALVLPDGAEPEAVSWSPGPIAFHLPAGTEQALTLTDLATRIAEGRSVRALADVGASGVAPERALARTVQAAVAMDVPVVLRHGTASLPPKPPGVLALLRVAAEARRGKPVEVLERILRQDDPRTHWVGLGELSANQVRRVRHDLPAYACADVPAAVRALRDLAD